MRSHRPHISPHRTPSALRPSPALIPLLLLLLLLLPALAHAQTPALSSAIEATLPGPFFDYTLTFNYTGFGTHGCDAIFASGPKLTYTPQATLRKSPPLSLPYETFALNNTPCTALPEAYTTSDAIPKSSSLRFGASLLVSPDGSEPDFALAAILVAPPSAQRSSAAPMTRVACPGNRGGVVLGDQVHVVLRESFSRPAFDPRRGEIEVRAGLRYALVAIGFADAEAGAGENLCILVADDDKLYQRNRNQEKRIEEEKNKKGSISTNAVIGIVFGVIGVMVVVGALLAWMHFRK